jgi:TPR repeat protein
MEPDYDRFCEGDAAEEAGDFAGARACFEQGARLGGHLCLSRLGHLFDAGRGAPLDKVRAKDCWRRAWRLGDVTAGRNIALTCRELGDRRGSVRWLRKAAAAGDFDALVDLAKLCISGEGLRRSMASAADYLDAALALPGIQSWEADEAKSMLETLRVGRIT